MRLSLKLGALCAIAAIVPVFIASALAIYMVASSSEQDQRERLDGKAKAAAAIYEKRLWELRSTAQKLADTIVSKVAINSADERQDPAATLKRIQDLLPPAQNEYSLDFIVIANTQGQVIARHNDRPTTGETLAAGTAANPLAQRVIAEALQQRNSPAAACVVESRERLAQLGLEIQAQVEGTHLQEALMLEACAPIYNATRFEGVVLIAQMLNNDYGARATSSSIQTPLVVEIRRTLFAGDDTEGGSLVGFDGVIIASSVPPAGAAKNGAAVALVGTRFDFLSKTSDNGFAVSWQPLSSLDGAQLGSLGVAIPAQELQGAAGAIRSALLFVGVAACVLAGAAGFFYGRALGARIESLTEAVSRMGVGELSASVKDPSPKKVDWLPKFLSDDEITRLAEELDLMRESFRQAIERLRKR